ncbi:MAG: DUF354 domain-containing protein, partial [Bacteroidales bacterium]|nr:DUF354 domain-containing protein [Bacteroidales bacterium]
ILIDISHPAHIHLFKNFVIEMNNRGHNILFTTRDKDITIKLLNHYNFSFISFGKNYNTTFGKIFGAFKFIFLIFKSSFKFKPDIFVSNSSVYNAVVSFFYRKPNILINNTDTDFLVKLFMPIVSCCLSSNSFNRNFGKKQIFFNGNNELAFLHPKYFTPNPNVLKQFNITKSDKLILIRFVSFTAFDDISSYSCMNDHAKRKIVSELLKYGKVFISSENKLPNDLEKYHLEKNDKYKTGQLQDIEYYATILFGESGAMASECAVLGTPALFVSSKKLGFIDELANKYSLVYNYTNYKEALEKAIQMLKMNNLKEEWEKKLRIFLSEKIDVTSFMVWFVENYPESTRLMKEKPCEVQEQFR